VGDQLAALALENNWAGIVVNGCIRDSEVINAMEIGIRALTTHPLKSLKNNYGQENVPVSFAGLTFRPGHYLYADLDGIVVAPVQLK
jgi:regulator of ribonuclease activity A